MKLLASAVLVSSLLVGCVEGGATTVEDRASTQESAAGAVAPDAGWAQGDGGYCDTDISVGRAYGVTITALAVGGAPVVAVPATPDTDVENPGSIVSLSLGVVADGAFDVQTAAAATIDSSQAGAVATTNGLAIDIPGLTLTAGTVVASAFTSAQVLGTTTSSSGSLIQDLAINGTTYANLDSPLTIPIPGVGEVRLLEIDGDAADVSVNAIHVVVTATAVLPLIGGATDVVVAHADSETCHQGY